MFLFWLLSSELPDFRQIVNNSSGGLKLALQNLKFYEILFQNSKKLMALQKLHTMTVQNLCINHIFILGA